jgi:hypothetical protein
MRSQLVNYVSNPSFEALNSFSSTSKYNVVEYWQPIDTGKACDYVCSQLPGINNAPSNPYTFQYPRTGNNYILTEFINYRGYPRNRLKERLVINKLYCAKFHIVSTNTNPYFIDGFGMYFGNETLDTIKYCNVALTYLPPQIKNPQGNVLKDTLKWVAITGTFVADGTEKYLVLGNFLSDAATTSVMANPTNSNDIGSVYCIDDVSCIELFSSAYAGPNWIIVPGDSAYIGSPSDIGVDEACSWYQLPGMIALDTVGGMWVKPATTTTYVIRQELECGPVKWDTVVVHIKLDDVGEEEIYRSGLRIGPVPAGDVLTISAANNRWYDAYKEITVTNLGGNEVLRSELKFIEDKWDINLSGLPDGLYFLTISGKSCADITMRFVKAGG